MPGMATNDVLDDSDDICLTGEVSMPQVFKNQEGLSTAVNRNVKVKWTNCDEGICGDYDEDDPDDANLLRFEVSVLRDGCWQSVHDASYCTEMPANTGYDLLARAAAYLAKEYANVLCDNPYASVKKLGEKMSWICPEWFTETKN